MWPSTRQEQQVGSHRLEPEPSSTPAETAGPSMLALNALNRVVRILAIGNALVGVALIVGKPGTSPALTFLRYIMPLPVWGAGYVAVAVLLLAGRRVEGHVVAVVLWLTIAGGAVLGVLTGSSASPAASTTLAVLTCMTASLHINGLLFRRRVARAGR